MLISHINLRSDHLWPRRQTAGLAPGGSLIVAVEAVYSMDGHCAPLVEMVEVAERFGAALVVDEAHSTGVHARPAIHDRTPTMRIPEIRLGRFPLFTKNM